MNLWRTSSLHCMWVTAVVFFLYLDSASAMMCYQCNSTLDSNCQEMWNHGSSTNAQKYRECHLHNAQFCVKVTGLWGGVVGTHRFCSARDLGYQCQEVWFPDHNRMYRACVYSCDSDGCNSVGRLSSGASLVLAGISGLYMLLRRL